MILPVCERQAALRDLYAPWRSVTLDGALDVAADRWPDRPLVITDDRSWTYAALQQWSRRIASGLARRGVGEGDRVALMLANYPEFVALKFAIARIGAIAVPVNILNRRDELHYILHQSGAKLLVVMDQFRGTDYLAMADELWAERDGTDLSRRLPLLGEIVVLATGEAGGQHDFTLFADLDDADDSFFSVVSADSDCDIIYTSGTTGAPKGVLLTHDMLTRTAFGSAYARAFEDGHRILFSLPMYHVYGYVEGLLAAMWVGGAIVPQLRFDAHATLAAIERHRATDALLIPAMTLAMLSALAERHYDLSTLHFVLSSGGRAPARIWQEIRDRMGVAEITTGYGMTETTGSTTVTQPDDPIERLLSSNGRLRDVGPAAADARANGLVSYRVLDPESGREVVIGAVGELIAKGPGVTRGYYDKPVETAASFTSDGWLRTGDLGQIDGDGYLTLVGRLKESYRCGGEQVLPSEVEDLLTTHPDVLQAHVVPLSDERMGEVGVAFVVARKDASPAPADLIALVADRLARFKVPRHLFLVAAEDIPITASGRARKFLLVEKAIAMVTPA